MKTKKMTNRRPRKFSGRRSNNSNNSKSRSESSGGRSDNRSRNYSRSRSRGRSRGSANNTFDVAGFIKTSERAQAARAEEPAKPVVIKHAFADFEVPQVLKDTLVKNGFIEPTEIQDQAIPEITAGHDVVGVANTGTGKTLAFVLPIAGKIIDAGRDDRGRRQRALIMCPTRELAQQVESEVAKLTESSRLMSVVCVGGLSIGKQIKQLQRRPEFVIGTPGRLKDLLDRGELDLSEFKYAILDEADQMLDMGFIHDMRYILDHFKTGHQTLLFSATMSNEIKRIIQDFARDPKIISVKRRETAHTVDQSVRSISGMDSKIDELVNILDHDKTGKTIVFCRTKRGSDRLARELKKRGINTESIHGDKPQRLRSKLLNRFRSHSIRVLVATDVAARGLDVDDITHVINFDAPQTQDDYVHRIGRTGRAGQTGTAITFV